MKVRVLGNNWSCSISNRRHHSGVDRPALYPSMRGTTDCSPNKRTAFVCVQSANAWMTDTRPLSRLPIEYIFCFGTNCKHLFRSGFKPISPQTIQQII